MKIAGYVKSSFVDYPGKIAAVVFTLGCNLNCYYCHNRDIIDPKVGGHILYTPDLLLSEFEQRKALLDAVVISGGEPTLQPGLAAFATKCKQAGFLVKLDTNGTMPEVVAELIKQNLLDFIAVDIKAPFEKYNSLALCEVNTTAIAQTVRIVKESGLPHQFRTTFAPDITAADVQTISREILECSPHYIINPYKTPLFTAGFADKRLSLPLHTQEEVNAANKMIGNKND